MDIYVWNGSCILIGLYNYNIKERQLSSTDNKICCSGVGQNIIILTRNFIFYLLHYVCMYVCMYIYQILFYVIGNFDVMCKYMFDCL